MNPNQFSLNKLLTIFLLIFLFFSCKSKVDKGKYWQTVPLANGLYVEVYKTHSQGAFGSDLIDDYLTDSVNFRVRIGTMDEYYDPCYYKLIGTDSILIQKSHRSDDTLGVLKIVEQNIYSLKALQKLQNISNPSIVNISMHSME